MLKHLPEFQSALADSTHHAHEAALGICRSNPLHREHVPGLWLKFGDAVQREALARGVLIHNFGLPCNRDTCCLGFTPTSAA